jgi:hypothetical protein
MHSTPKKGSWLNMAEIEFSALAIQCLDRRLSDQKTLEREVLAWSQKRNQARTTVHWKFTKYVAREKLNSKYPVSIN